MNQGLRISVPAFPPSTEGAAVSKPDRVALIQELMGASHIFCSAVGELLERTLEEAGHGELAMSQVKLLLLVSRPNQRFKVSDVAAFLDVTNAAASRAIDRLVQRGLIDRRLSKEDRRAVELDVTDEGRRVLDTFAEVRNRELVGLLGDHPEKRIERAISLLDELSVLLLDLDPDKAQNDRCLRCGIHLRKHCVVKDVLGRECSVSRALYGADDDEG